MTDIKELKDDKLKTVNGGGIDKGVSSICPQCQYFIPKNPNGKPDQLNCKKFNEIANICPGWSDAGGLTRSF